ncbi:MAG: thaumatin family protein [Methylotetracoccus sp.]
MISTLVRAVLLLSTLAASGTAIAARPFKVTQQTPVLNMVAGSTQQLQYQITTTQQGNPVIVYCSINKDALDTVNLQSGCTNPNGAGVEPGKPVPIVVNLKAGQQTGAVSHVLTVTDKTNPADKLDIDYRIVKGSRKVTFRNQCPFDVWFGVASGSVAPKSGSSCTSDNDCPAGAACASNNACYWKNPAPADGNYRLTAYSGSGQPASNSITIPDKSASNGLDQVWSGGFGARTRKGGAWATGDCGSDGNGGCKLGVGFAAPVTQMEVTMKPTTPDSYDVTIINGFNVPMQMAPNVAVSSANPYDCGTPGTAKTVHYTTSDGDTGALGGCTWKFTPPQTNYRYQFVDASPGGSCRTNADCGANKACGLTTANVKKNSDKLSCGTLLGYWTQDQVCATNKGFSQSSIVDCTTTQYTPAVGPNTYTLFNLLACTSSPPEATDDKSTFVSCFAKDGATSSPQCCGCVNWQSKNVKVPTDPSIVAQCQPKSTTAKPNSNWVNGVLPGLTWLKKACPSAYTYPYDDKTATFGCPSSFNGGQSAVNYTLTFCPGGRTGMPSTLD